LPIKGNKNRPELFYFCAFFVSWLIKAKVERECWEGPGTTFRHL
jgi:hypothetical protein